MKPIAQALRDKGFVLESCYGNKDVCFELWVSHSRKEAVMLWTVDRRSQDPISSIAQCSFASPDEVTVLPVSHQYAHFSIRFMSTVQEVFLALPLAFPEQGISYPEILNRAFERAVSIYDVRCYEPKDD